MTFFTAERRFDGSESSAYLDFFHRIATSFGEVEGVNELLTLIYPDSLTDPKVELFLIDFGSLKAVLSYDKFWSIYEICVTCESTYVKSFPSDTPRCECGQTPNPKELECSKLVAPHYEIFKKNSIVQDSIVFWDTLRNALTERWEETGVFDPFAGFVHAGDAVEAIRRLMDAADRREIGFTMAALED